MQEMECAYNYWRGVRTYKPLLELLVSYPVIISCLVENGTAERYGIQKGSVNTIKRASLRKLRNNAELCAAYAC